jgi:type 1 fimbria pilin
VKTAAFAASALLVLVSGAASATDVRNEDSKAYEVTVQGEGNLSISKHQLKAGSTLSGLCGYSFCTFAIAGSKVTAQKEDRLTVRGGKFVK